MNQATESISALLRSSKPRAGDLRVLVEQARRSCDATASVVDLLNSRILVGGAYTTLAVLAAGLADAGSALACLRVLLSYDADPGLVPSCAACRGGAATTAALLRRPGFVPPLHPGRDTFPLHAAAERGSVSVAEALLAAGERGHRGRGVWSVLRWRGAAASSRSPANAPPPACHHPIPTQERVPTPSTGGTSRPLTLQSHAACRHPWTTSTGSTPRHGCCDVRWLCPMVGGHLRV